MEIMFENNQVIIPIPKAVLVMTWQQFIEALKRGKAYRRAQQRSARVKPIEGDKRGKTLRQKPPTGLEQWDLHQFIEVAAEGDSIGTDTASQARLAKDFRNLIHPGRALRLERVCDRGTALSAVAAVEHVVRDLVSRQDLSHR
jgi:hypothetical protein